MLNSREVTIEFGILEAIHDHAIRLLFENFKDRNDEITHDIYHLVLACILAAWPSKRVEKKGEAPVQKVERAMRYLCGRELTVQKKIIDKFYEILLDHKATENSVGYVIDYVHQEHLQTIVFGGESEPRFSNRRENRKEKGAFFTPYHIAKEIVEGTIPANQVDIYGRAVIDIACGSGVFLSAALHHLSRCRVPVKEILTKRLFGNDVDSTSVKLAKYIVQREAEISFDSAINRPIVCNIQVEDTITAPLKQVKDLSVAGDSKAQKFTAIVMNPPYDRLKLDGGSACDKQKVKDYVALIRASKIYPLSASGSLDTFRLFIERATQLVANPGRIGAIVPMTFLADKSASGLRQHFLEKNSLASLTLFPENIPLFKGVNQATCIFIAEQCLKKDRDIHIQVAETTMLRRPLGKITANLVKKVSPLSCPIPITDSKGLELLELMHQHPRIGDLPGIKNRRGELDLTFHKEFIGVGKDCLLRGSHISHFSVTGTENVDGQGFLLTGSSEAKKNDASQDRIAGQQISNLGNKHRLKFALVPRNSVLANSLNYLLIDRNDRLLPAGFTIYSLLGYMNSIVLDWRFRLTSSNNHVNNYEIDDLPLPLSASFALHSEIDKLVRSLCASNGDSISARVKLEALVLKAYGATSYRKYLFENHPAGSALDSKLGVLQCH